LNREVFGDVLLERLSRSAHQAVLKKETQEFRAVHAGYAKACDKVAAAQASRDAMLDDIATADDALDQALLLLADRLSGAGLGERKNPFAAFSSHSPARLVELGYAEEAREADALVAAVRKKKPPADVMAAVKRVEDAAKDATTALKALAGPQADYELAMQARDSLLLGWNKVLGRVKRAAAVAYDDDKPGLRGLFAKPQDLQTKKPPARRPPKNPPPPPA
jgi:hypothetical protein